MCIETFDLEFTSFLRRFSRLVPSIEEWDIGSTVILTVRGPLRVLKKVIFMLTNEETTPLQGGGHFAKNYYPSELRA